MKTIYLAIFISVLSIFPALSSDLYEYEFEELRTKFTTDGDTPYISIRLFGIDAPESDQQCERANGTCYDCGVLAKRNLDGLLTDDATYKFTGAVTYGRPVATIFLNQLDVNKEMVRLGQAIVYERFLKGDMKDEYLKAQDEAKSLKRGIWQGKFIEPSDWRNGERLACESN